MDFTTASAVWWNPVSFQLTENELVCQLNEYKNIIQEGRRKPENELRFIEYYLQHYLVYLRETCIGESNIRQGTTIHELSNLLQGKGDNPKTIVKVQNLNRAVKNLFPNIYETSVIVDEFTPEFLKIIHRTVGDGLIEHSGSYRTQWAAPQNERWMYLDPKRISSHLEKLCCNIRNLLRQSRPENVVTRVKIAAYFLTNFLHIHPFTNGNGRVARLAVSWILASCSIVPVSLYTCNHSRETFLQCIRESRQTRPFKPSSLARLILESVVDVHRIVCESIGLATDNSLEDILNEL